MDVAFFQYAPEWIKTFAKRKGIANIEAYGWCRRYDEPLGWEPKDVLRNRLPEMEAALTGMSTKEHRIFVVYGRELTECGWGLAGAQLAQKFSIILA